MHAGGVLADALLRRQAQRDVRTVFAPKVATQRLAAHGNILPVKQMAVQNEAFRTKNHVCHAHERCMQCGFCMSHP